MVKQDTLDKRKEEVGSIRLYMFHITMVILQGYHGNLAGFMPYCSRMCMILHQPPSFNWRAGCRSREDPMTFNFSPLLYLMRVSLLLYCASLVIREILKDQRQRKMKMLGVLLFCLTVQ